MPVVARDLDSLSSEPTKKMKRAMKEEKNGGKSEQKSGVYNRS